MIGADTLLVMTATFPSVEYRLRINEGRLVGSARMVHDLVTCREDSCEPLVSTWSASLTKGMCPGME